MNNDRKHSILKNIFAAGIVCTLLLGTCTSVIAAHKWSPISAAELKELSAHEIAQQMHNNLNEYIPAILSGESVLCTIPDVLQEVVGDHFARISELKHLYLSQYLSRGNAINPRWSPSGRYLIYAAENYANKSIKLFDSNTLEDIEIATVRGHYAQWHACVRWSPSDRYIAFFATKNSFTLFDLKTGVLRTLEGRPGSVRFSPLSTNQQTQYISFGTSTNMNDDANTTTLLNLESGETQRFAGSAFNVRWSPHGDYLTYGTPQRIHLLNLHTGEDINLNGYAPDAQWAPTGTHLAFGIIGESNLYNLETGEITPLGGDAKRVRWSHSGNFVTYPVENRLEMCNVLTQERMIIAHEDDQYPVVGGIGNSVQWCPSQDIFTYGSKRSVILYNAQTDEHKVLEPGMAHEVRWSTSGKHLAYKTSLIARPSNTGRMYFLEHDRYLDLRKVSDFSFRWSPTGRYCTFKPDGGGTLWLLDVNTQGIYKMGYAFCEVQWSPSGRHCIFGDRNNAYLYSCTRCHPLAQTMLAYLYTTYPKLSLEEISQECGVPVEQLQAIYEELPAGIKKTLESVRQ